MSPGKLAAQAGHAFIEAFEACRKIDPGRAAAYHDGSHGTKVVLAASLDVLLQTYEQARTADLPCCLITDAGHVMLPHFDGSPTITAVGIGPVTRAHSHAITRRLPLVR
jgi:peptidyl-tRNA hydrolase